MTLCSTVHECVIGLSANIHAEAFWGVIQRYSLQRPPSGVDLREGVSSLLQ